VPSANTNGASAIDTPHPLRAKHPSSFLGSSCEVLNSVKTMRCSQKRNVDTCDLYSIFRLRPLPLKQIKYTVCGTNCIHVRYLQNLRNVPSKKPSKIHNFSNITGLMPAPHTYSVVQIAYPYKNISLIRTGQCFREPRHVAFTDCPQKLQIFT
jgi:hypothetical protein